MLYGYVRVSTSDQASDEKSSLAEQERRIRGCASMRSDDPDVTIFSDPGVSGSMPLDQRPGGIKLLASLKQGDTLIAAKLDRLFRSTSDALNSVDAFHKQGIDVILLDISTEPISSNGVGRLFFSILASVAEFERWRIAERLADGRSAKVAKGGYMGGRAPYGYRAIGEGSHAILAEYEPEQRVIHLIHDLRSELPSINRVYKELAERGITNREGKPFTFECVRRILMRGRPQKEAAE